MTPAIHKIRYLIADLHFLLVCDIKRANVDSITCFVFFCDALKDYIFWKMVFKSVARLEYRKSCAGANEFVGI